MSFHGSYHADDVTFLLKPVHLAPTEIAEKERLIQSGERHYSEMISTERLPSAAYLRVFHEALARRNASHAMSSSSPGTSPRFVPTAATLVSLARAGTPIGVLLRRTLHLLTGKPIRHYSVSIIRDRGIDVNALCQILDESDAGSLVFLDGWTGKGVIARELKTAIRAFNATLGIELDDGLYTIADLCGESAFASTSEDYLIPSSVLGATISGLVSRSILNHDVIGPDDFHGCIYLDEFADHDLSRWFVDEMFASIERQIDAMPDRITGVDHPARARLRQTSDAFLADVRERYGVFNVNHVKPGIGEATRVLLRRVPDRLLVRSPGVAGVSHLLVLAEEKNVPVVVDPALPYAAAALIKELDG